MDINFIHQKLTQASERLAEFSLEEIQGGSTVKVGGLQDVLTGLRILNGLEVGLNDTINQVLLDYGDILNTPEDELIVQKNRGNQAKKPD